MESFYENWTREIKKVIASDLSQEKKNARLAVIRSRYSRPVPTNLDEIKARRVFLQKQRDAEKFKSDLVVLCRQRSWARFFALDGDTALIRIVAALI